MTSTSPMTQMAVKTIRFYGALAERQLRLMGEVNRAILRPNPFLFALAEMQTLGAITEPPGTTSRAPAPKPAPVAKSRPKGKRTHRQPSTPPDMPKSSKKPTK